MPKENNCRRGRGQIMKRPVSDVPESASIRLMLFDLGGVLVRYGGYQRFLEWTGGSITSRDLWDWWLNNRAVRLLETGRMTCDHFADHIIRHFRLPATRQEFLSEMRSWFAGSYPGAREMLLALRESCHLAVLSNTNDVFWAGFEETDIYGLFNHYFASHRMACMKPDSGAYQAVLHATGLPARSILFFDDQQPNVDAARNTGMQAVQVHGLNEVKMVLKRMGFF